MTNQVPFHEAVAAQLDATTMYDSEVAARAQALRIPQLGAALAQLDVPEDGPIRFRQMGSNPAHHTVWGEPNDLLARIVAVLPVAE